MFALTVTATALGLVVGFLRGGRLTRLAETPVRMPWLAGIAWLMQALLFSVGLPDAWSGFTVPIFFTSMALVGVVIVANRQIPGLVLFGVGLLMNASVLTANGGFMPVADTALQAAGSSATIDIMRERGRVQKTFLMRPDSPLWFLGDVLPFPPARKVYSPGDLVAGVGVFLLVVGGMGRGASRTTSSAQPAPLTADRGG